MTSKDTSKAKAQLPTNMTPNMTLPRRPPRLHGCPDPSATADVPQAGADAGQKIAQAAAKGVEVWTEEQFRAAAEGPPAGGKGGKTGAAASASK